ncbi:MAG TPA: hypothetical protein VFG85_03190 [Gaiellaceae bacterium]|jgi:hypothetical protein|nr:hypothetical protein [Gaiellaceae bacterium]
MTALGGLAPWTRWQFVGAFGVIEAASGLANVITPNVWRLPIAELETSRRTELKLTPSVVLLPHWGGLARWAAGVVCIGLAAWKTGLGPASVLLVPFVLLLAWSIVAISTALARGGIARPDIDVVQLVVRWKSGEHELTPVSLGAAVFQFLLAIVTIPAVKLFSPSVLYQPEIGPSAEALLGALAISLALLGLVYWLWSDRLERKAPRDQQREAEEHA